MTSCKCHRCGKHWAFNSGHPDAFDVICKFCPNCIPVILPLAGLVGA